MSFEVFTGNFANAKKYSDKGYTLVSIARYEPKWFRGESVKELAPLSWMLKLPERVYTPEFKKYVLNNQVPSQVMRRLSTLSKGKPVVLLCYEKAGDFCHRRLVAEWLEKNLGIEVKELGNLSEQTDKQLGLF